MAYIRNSPTTGLPFTAVFPSPIYEKRNPTKHDSQNFPLGQEWINTADLLSWELMSLELEPVTNIQVATWVLMGNSALGSVTALQADDANLANPLGGIISVSGFHNINTTADGVNTLTVAMDNEIVLGDLAVVPPGSPALTVVTGDIFILEGSLAIPLTLQNQGWIYIEGQPFAGAPVHISNTVVGTRPPAVLAVTGINNSAFGSISLNKLTSGQGNTCAGHGSLNNLTTGNYNSCLGISSGLALTSNETANIYVGAFAGAIGNTGENRTIRIGARPADVNSPLHCYVQGIANVVVPNQNLVTVDTATGKLGGSHSIDNFAQQFNANTGGLATPIFGILNIFGQPGVLQTNGAGDTVTINLDPAFYQTGAWTPVLNFGGDPTGFVYAAQVGSYVKIGNLLWIQGIVDVTTLGVGVGVATVTGLPFNVQGRFCSTSHGIVYSAGFTEGFTISAAAYGSGPGSTTLWKLALNGGNQPVSSVDFNISLAGRCGVHIFGCWSV